MKLPSAVAATDASEVLSFAISLLPKLPSVLRYEDDYDGRVHTINGPATSDRWSIVSAGSLRQLDFGKHVMPLRQLTKWLVADTLTHLAPATSSEYGRQLLTIPSEVLERLINANPQGIRNSWHGLFTSPSQVGQAAATKALLRLCCVMHLLDWSPPYMPLVSALPAPHLDPYHTLRTGDAFLTVPEEARLVRLFEQTARRAAESPMSISDEDLMDVALLLLGYQFGMRPVQIGRLQLSGYTAWHSASGEVTVHLAFPMAKQRDPVARALTLNRRVKREWTSIIVEHHRRRALGMKNSSEKFFSLPSANAIGQRMRWALKLNGLKGRTAYSLRHTAAQRLADAGASAEELAEFLGHTVWTTCLVYFDVTPVHAARVNKALGLSDTFQRVASIAEAKFISPEQLAQLKGEQQIGGVPHGIEISGIGGCESGQPACPFNPVLSCYGCPKFMPVLDSTVHRQTLKSLRSIVDVFELASRGESSSAAFMQLQRTIAEVQTAIVGSEGQGA